MEERAMLSGSELVADINVQPPLVEYDRGIVFDGKLYFDGGSFAAKERGRLWRFDPEGNNGTGKTTYLAGYEEGFFDAYSFAILNDKIMFGAYGDTGRELWEFDPSANGGEGAANLIADSSDGRTPNNFNYDVAVLNGSLYYRVSGVSGKLELWRYDPDSAEVITRVASIDNTGWGSPDLEIADGKLYFYLKGASNQFQLWQYDPAIEGPEATTLVVDHLTYSFNQPSLESLGGKIYFSAEDEDHGIELWEYDPSANDGEGATTLVADVIAGPQSSYVHRLTALDSKLYFSARSGSNFWEYDPALQTYREIESSGDLSVSVNSGSPFKFSVIDGSLYFPGTTNLHGEALLRYDPAGDHGPEQFSVVADVTFGADDTYIFPDFITGVGGDIFFPVAGLAFGDTLWHYDPAGNDGAGSVDPVRAELGGTDTSDPEDLTPLGAELYFRAHDGIHGMELWKYDSTAQGGLGAAELVADIFEGPGSSMPESLTAFEGKLYFSATDETSGKSLWRYDPATEALTRLADFPNQYPAEDWVVLDGRLYFPAGGGSNGQFTVRYFDLGDTGSGEVEIASDPSQGGPRSPNELTVVGDQLFFIAFDQFSRRRLWRFDPAADNGAGTAFPIEDYDSPWEPRYLTELNGKLYFRGYSQTHGMELWEHDPAANNGLGRSQRLSDINPGLQDAMPEQLTAVNGKLYFVARDSSWNFNFWQYDPAKTDDDAFTLLHSLPDYQHQGLNTYLDHSLPVIDGIIYVDVQSPYGGEQVWWYDTLASEGDEAFGFAPVVPEDIYSPYVYDLTAINGQLVFVALDRRTGRELYRFTPAPRVTAVELQLTPGATTPLTEWQTAPAELWLTVGHDRPDQPFDLTWQLSDASTWFTQPQLVSHLGTSAELTSNDDQGTLVTTGTIFGIDLSAYAPGDRVLVATLQFMPDPENPVGVPMDTTGDYPAAVTPPGLVLVSAENGSTGEAFDHNPLVTGQFVPVIYDADDNGAVGLSDFSGFVAHFGLQVADDADAYRFDYDRNGKVGLSDFVLFVRAFGDHKAAELPPLTRGLAAEPTPWQPLRREQEPEPTATTSLLEAGTGLRYVPTLDLPPPASRYVAAAGLPAPITAEPLESELPMTTIALDPRLVDAVVETSEIEDRLASTETGDDDWTAVMSEGLEEADLAEFGGEGIG